MKELSLAAIQALVSRFAGQHIVKSDKAVTFEGIAPGGYTILALGGESRLLNDPTQLEELRFCTARVELKRGEREKSIEVVLP